jgi:hypothetical protein
MNCLIHLELDLGQMMKKIVFYKHWFFAFHIRLCNQISVISTLFMLMTLHYFYIVLGNNNNFGQHLITPTIIV